MGRMWQQWPEIKKQKQNHANKAIAYMEQLLNDNMPEKQGTSTP